jgi:preprotein translocase subunit SecF
MFMIVKPNINIDFVGKRAFFIFLSTVLILASLILIFTRGINYGIDFTGGIEIQVKFNDNVEIQELRNNLNEIKGADDLGVQSFGDNSNEFLIRLKGEESNIDHLNKSITQSFIDNYGQDKFEVLKVDMVGPRVGKELRTSGFLAVLYALIGILIYVAIRFDFKYSPGAVAALIHDIIITVGVFSLLQRQFSLSTIAALLTIVGYSLNDTVVVFDRLRETIGKSTLALSLVNKALNDTLSRTILTSLTTLLVVICLFIFGVPVIFDFALALLIGITVGTYSTLFVAIPTVLYFDKLYSKKN